MSAEPRMQFNGIWPTLLIRRRLPEFEQPTEALAAYITEMEAREADLTARFREQSFFASTLPAVQWLKGHVEQTAEAIGISEATVKREWTLARAWLRRELGKSF